MEAEDLTPEVAYVYELVWPGTDEIYIGSTSYTPEERRKHSEAARGRKHTEEAKRNMSEALKGRKFSKDWKYKLSEAAQNRQKTPCPHCGKVVDPANMKRWHGDNCKHR